MKDLTYLESKGINTENFIPWNGTMAFFWDNAQHCYRRENSLTEDLTYYRLMTVNIDDERLERLRNFHGYVIWKPREDIFSNDAHCIRVLVCALISTDYKEFIKN